MLQLEEEVDGETMLDLEALVSASFNTMLKGAITKMNHNYLMLFFAPPPL